MSFEAKLEELGHTLEPVELDIGRFMHSVRTGSLVYTSGQVAWGFGVEKGKVGDDITVEQGYEAARLATLNCLRAVKSLVGSLDQVVRVVRVTGFVNVAPGFTDTPAVIHGASDLILEVFGDAGRHARTAVGVTLPSNYPAEVELIVEVK